MHTFKRKKPSYPARLGTANRIMRGANHDKPMIMAGPTPKSDIRPVTKGSPKIFYYQKLNWWEQCVPITVEAAAKLWTSYSSGLELSPSINGRIPPKISLETV